MDNAVNIKKTRPFTVEDFKSGKYPIYANGERVQAITLVEFQMGKKIAMVSLNWNGSMLIHNENGVHFDPFNSWGLVIECEKIEY